MHFNSAIIGIQIQNSLTVINLAASVVRTGFKKLYQHVKLFISRFLHSMRVYPTETLHCAACVNRCKQTRGGL